MPLTDLKRLAARLLIAEELSPMAASEAASVRERVAERLRDQFSDFNGLEHLLTTNTISVEEVLLALLERSTKIRVDLVQDVDREEFDGFLNRLTQRISVTGCKKCVGNGQQACNDQASPDAARLERGGLCIRTVNEVYKYLFPQIRAVLTAWGYGAGHLNDLVNVRIDRRFVSGRDDVVAAVNPTCHVSACTRFADAPAPGKRTSIITLEFDAGRFDLNSLLCLPWLLTHELVCHVFQGRAGVRRSACSRGCPFYEGWMDEVAWLLFEQEMGEPVIPTSVLRPRLFDEHRKGVLKHAKGFRTWRHGPKSRRAQFPYAGLHYGSTTARSVLSFFRQRLSSQTPLINYWMSLQLLVKLSIAIQRLDPSRVEAETFMKHLSLLAGYGQMAQCSKADVMAIRDALFSRARNTQVWLDGLQAICDRLRLS